MKIRNFTAQTLPLGDSIVKGLNTYKGTWYKYFPNSFNFGITEDCAENIPWRSLNFPDIPYLTNVIILCWTNNICIYSPYEITQSLLDIAARFRIYSPRVKIFISGVLSRDKCYSLNSILMKEINKILKCKCAFHRFNFIEQEQAWTNKNDTLDPSLFYQDKLYLIQKGSIKLSETVIAAKEDKNICQNTHLKKMTVKKLDNFAGFTLPSSNLLSFPGIKSYLLPSTLKLNLSSRPSFPPGTSSSPNFQHMSSSIKICLFLMTSYV